jgi:dephospho-CoA kinase
MAIIILTGMPGSGKGEFVAVARRRGYQVVTMGDVVRDEAARQGIAMNDSGVGGFASAERQRHGGDIWAARTLPRIRSDRTIIDGSRGTDELARFRAGLGQRVRVVAIHTAPQERFRRLQRRERPDAPKTWQEFADRDMRELSWGLGNLIALADVMMLNDGDLDTFRVRVDELLAEMG